MASLAKGDQYINLIPYISSKISSSDLSFKWYIVGTGSPAMGDLINEEIKKYKMGDFVELLGEKDNPYPFLSRAGLMVVVSLFEGYPTVTNEAKVLGTPVISVPYSGIEEILFTEDGEIAPIGQMHKTILERIYQFKKLGRTEKITKSFNKHNSEVKSRLMNLLEGNLEDN